VQGSPVGSLLLLVLLFGLFYFMLIRPQRRRVQQHQRLVDSLEPGDDVVTIGGLYGTIVSIGDEDVELEVSSGTTLRFLKSAIARRILDEEEEDEAAGELEEGAGEEDEPA
jgi:preprotein translocase subunit YajC